jgi:hypothetical protein
MKAIAYLLQHLEEAQRIGVNGRRASTFSTDRIGHIYQGPP